MNQLPKKSFRLGTRVCLGGEGLGLYAGKAITIPIDLLSTNITIEHNYYKGIEILNKNLSKESYDEFYSGVLAVLRTYNKYKMYPDNICITIESSVPIGFGLASSATFYACLTIAINNYFSYKLTTTELIQIAYSAEHIEQGVLVGLTDTYAVMYRKILLQDHSQIPSKLIELTMFPSNTTLIIVGDTPSSYKHIGLQLKERIIAHEEGVVRYANKVSNLIPLLSNAFKNNDKVNIQKIVALLFESVCIDMNINNPSYHNMIKKALSAGAYAAKNIGLRSHGGSIYALCESRFVSQVVEVLNKFCTFVYLINNKHIK